MTNKPLSYEQIEELNLTMAGFYVKEVISLRGETDALKAKKSTVFTKTKPSPV